MKKYNWAMIGTGGIAVEMANALSAVNGEIYAVTSGHLEHAEKFAAAYGVQHSYSTCEEMLMDQNVDIVYVATPHNLHYEYIMKALQAGKHVLCEKAITINAEQMDEAVALSREKKLVLMEAMTIYHMPVYKKLKEMVTSGVIGKVKLIQVNFGSCKEYDTSSRFFNKELAGGALLDIGVYAAAFARYFLDETPESILTTVNYFETGVDEQSGIIMKNSSDQMAVMALSMRARQPKRGIVAGELGYIEVNDYPRADKATITYTESGITEEIAFGDMTKALQYEIQDMQKAVENKAEEEDLQYSIDVMHILNEIENQWKLVENKK